MSAPGRRRTYLRLRKKVFAPSQECANYLGVFTRVRPHSHVLRAQPKQVVGNILSVSSAFEKLKYLRDVAFILVPGLWDASNADWIPHVVKDFVDSAKKLFVLWQQIQCLVPDQAFGEARFGSEADI